MLKLDYLSVVRFSGSDAGSFLHGQVSADVLGLDSGDSTFACYCEPKGRVLALMLVHRVGEEYFVIMSDTLVASVSQRLELYVMRSDVMIEVLSDHMVSGLYADKIPEPASTSTCAMRLAGSSQWLLVTSHDTAANTNTVSQADWKISELQLGITWLNPGTSGQFLPQWLGFEELGAVNYHKGCYPGQEIVARTHYLGKVKRHPRLLNSKLAFDPEPMDKIGLISDGQPYDGIIVDFGSAKDGNVCLLVVTRMDPDLVAGQVEYLGKVTEVN
jgi:hypothetical protein